jgi:hypothetical protein
MRLDLLPIHLRRRPARQTRSGRCATAQSRYSAYPSYTKFTSDKYRERPRIHRTHRFLVERRLVAPLSAEDDARSDTLPLI